MRRGRRAIAWLGASLLATASASADPAPGFDLDSVRAIARSLSQEAYRSPEKSVPEYLLKLDYDSHRDIRFKPARSIWRDKGLPFQIQLFHLGLYFNRPVAINFVEKGVARPFPFDPSLFDYGRNHFPEPLPPTLGYAGLRVHNRINRKDYFDEVIVFARRQLLPRRRQATQIYGLSARGIAIDTAQRRARGVPVLQASSGSSSRRRGRKRSRSTRCSTARASPGPTASWSTPGEQTRSTSRAGVAVPAHARSSGSASRR